MATQPVARDSRVLVALPRGAVNFLGVSPARAGLVGAMGFGSLSALVAYLVIRSFSIDGADEQ
ncbi:MAG: hypothetical protein IVW52_18860 [Acidimicrobiales bacterium]|nr:hypothetical protein [Acidimicrobiales bacterium]